MDLRQSLIALALAASVLPAAPGAAAQQAAPSFGEAIDVRVVNVEAVVTDGRGDRVRGLTAKDFRLLVDGREVPVDYFTEVADGEMAALPGDEGPAAAVSSAPDGQVGTSYLVFIDNSFSVAAARNLVLARVASDLGRLRAEDQVAVVAFDGRRLDLLAGWTADRKELQEVLERAKSMPTRGLARLAARRSEVRVARSDGQGEVIPDPFSPWGLFPEIQEAVSAAGAALRGVPKPSPSRKVLVLLSGGWPVVSPTTLAFDPFRAFSSPFEAPEVEELFQPLTDSANLLGYTIYPVDVAGLETSPVPSSREASADFSAPGLARGSFSVGEGSPIQPLPLGYVGEGLERVTMASPNILRGAGGGFITSDWEQGVHHAFGHLARETGGKEVLNTARTEALERVADDTQSYYWLGFTPTWQGDGGRHDIRVQLVRPGLKVRSRRGYSDLSRDARFALDVESRLLFGGDSLGVPLQVTAGAARRKGLTKITLPITVEIPAESVTALPSGQGYRVRALLAMAALDRYGARSRVMVLPIEITLDQAPAPGGTARYETTIELRRTDQRLLFALGDGLGSTRLWTELAVKL